MEKNDNRTRYCLFPDHLKTGHRVSILVDGEAIMAMREAIERAEYSVVMESYIFNDDVVGWAFSDVLRRKAREGVAVFLTVDGIGTVHVPGGFFDTMRAAGVNVLVYHPLLPWKKGFGLWRRNHRKLLVVDGRVGFVGGVNVGKEWLPISKGGLGWHDIHLRISGPAVQQLKGMAVRIWRKRRAAPCELPTFKEGASDAALVQGHVAAQVIGTRVRKGKRRRLIRRAYLYAIRRSTHYVFLTNAYFLPDRGIRRALRNAVRRGVDVRIMVPAHGDVWAVQMASQALYARMLRWGIRLLRWTGPVLHAKTAVIDDSWCTVGSYNMDWRSLEMNLEVNVMVLDDDVADDLKQVFLRDQANCEEVVLSVWRRRSWWIKVIEAVCFRFRKLL